MDETKNLTNGYFFFTAIIYTLKHCYKLGFSGKEGNKK